MGHSHLPAAGEYSYWDTFTYPQQGSILIGTLSPTRSRGVFLLGHFHLPAAGEYYSRGRSHLPAEASIPIVDSPTHPQQGSILIRLGDTPLPHT
jgi:hypothetical protein